MNETISRLLDDDLGRRECGAAVSSLGADELRTVERYQMIGALMRREATDAAVAVCRNRVSMRIAEAIEREPAWMLPRSGRRGGRGARSTARFAAFAGGFAAAAAIAAVAVTALVSGPLATVDRAPAPLAAVDDVGPAASAMDRDELGSLLIEHGEFTGSAGLNGLVAYAKFVSSGGE